MSQKSFLDNKKITEDFPYVGGEGGVNQHMENSICFVVFIFESFPYLVDSIVVKLQVRSRSRSRSRSWSWSISKSSSIFNIQCQVVKMSWEKSGTQNEGPGETL